jgi:hypothetical protein
MPQPKLVYYQNNLGEVCEVPRLARFKDARGNAWVVIHPYRHGDPICLKAERLLSRKEALVRCEQVGQTFFL